MTDEEAFDNERKGASVGLNPMFGDWQHRFELPPIPHGDGTQSGRHFRARSRPPFPNQFFYSTEVRVEITLHLDVQKVLETSETADLDNYAKSILDGLKGPSGVLFDDSQVQTLIISWLDTLSQGPHFDVSISGSPDDFMLKPVAFYEMPDGLWHPHSRKVWIGGAAEEQSDCDPYTGLHIIETITAAKRSGRHMIRQAGLSRLRARQRLLPISASVRGFHRSRIDAGFEMWELRRWRAAFDEWRRGHPNEAEN